VVDLNNTKNASNFRSRFYLVDENMFVTNFVLYGLLEADQLSTIKINQTKFRESLEAMSKFRDKNSSDGVPKYCFWSQKKINGMWSSTSPNYFGYV
jgi:hypothetical protein